MNGVYLQIVDLDKVFHDLSEPPIIVNDFDLNSIEEKEKLNAMLYTRYEGDTLETLPSCDCGHIKGQYNIGVKCGRCLTEVEVVTERSLHSVMWIAAPEGVTSLMNPEAYIILSEKLKYAGGNLLEWITNTSYKLKTDPKRLCEKYINAGFKRGLNYFIANFDEIIEFLFKVKALNKTNGKTEKDSLRQFLFDNKPLLFPKYLPVPSKLGFITENTPMGVFADTNMALAIDAIRTITSIKAGLGGTTQIVRENRAAKAIKLLSDYYHGFYKDSLAGKQGWYRKHIFGSRVHFSFRAVISSISNNHSYEELHLPWGLSIALFKAHLTNKLMRKYRMTPNECIKYLYANISKHDDILEELFKELIDESPEKSIPVILQRNPTLVRLSAQYLKVTKIKNDPYDTTISMSVMDLKGPNADFDGDALNGMLILDQNMKKKLQRFAPHLGVLDLDKPRSISKNIVLHSPTLSTISNWMYEGK